MNTFAAGLCLFNLRWQNCSLFAGNLQMRKALLFLKVLPNVMELEKETLNIVYKQETELYEKKMDEIKNKLEIVRKLVLQLSKNEALNESINDSINRVLSLLDS